MTKSERSAALVVAMIAVASLSASGGGEAAPNRAECVRVARDEQRGRVLYGPRRGESAIGPRIRCGRGEHRRDVAKQGTTWTWLENYVYRDGTLMAAELPGTPSRLQFHLDHLGTPPLDHGRRRCRDRASHVLPIRRRGHVVRARQRATQKFTGHGRDGHSLDYMHARYYTPEWGRFLSIDPVLNLKAATKNPQRRNRYSYISNNPINAVDPDGRDQRFNASTYDWQGLNAMLEITGEPLGKRWTMRHSPSRIRRSKSCVASSSTVPKRLLPVRR